MSHRSVRLLVVDDDTVDRIAILRALRSGRVDAEIREADSVDSALAVLYEQQIDCVLLDFYLPGGDGLAVIEAARKAKLTAPFIMLTGQGDESLAVDLMKRGAADYVPKNLLTPERLVQSLRYVLRLNEAERREDEARRALARHANQLAQLTEATLRIHRSLSLNELIQRTTDEARALLDANVAVARLAARGVTQRSMTGTSLSEEYAAREDRDGIREIAFGLIERRSTSVRLTDEEIASDPTCADVLSRAPSELHPRSLLAAPLRGRDGQCIGSIQLLDRRDGPFVESDEVLLTQLAQSASVALENARLYNEAQAATRARDDLLAIVSHDLRNPLNTIAITASLLRSDLLQRKDGEEDDAVQLVDRMDRGIQRMTRLIEDLLDASRIEAGRLVVSPRVERGGALVREALEAAASLAEAKGCRVTQGPFDAGLEVLADRDRVLQVFSNLLGNALKFTPKGGIVSVSLCRVADLARFSVADTGPGIPPEHQPHLFDRYWKASQESRTGAGLGLYIARGIVEAHHGTVAVESTPGHGTTIHFTLPLAS
ncbi:hybrid sensor histidine kinase/response regulator [Sorangium cellulosum]|uniref:histidine kinase n=1 Tax=Sorangium cellulosum TaxID=56 RepID=A0A150QVH1_SORCE|nr:ATP-binding protein [Sorangium cellulosum]KYF71822.1 histidine kinase [Sorangium cellulosum]